MVHPGAVTILAIDPDDRILLVRQWRVAVGQALLELPAGTLDVHDGVTEDPDVAAIRELEEETGYRAGTWRRVASFWTAPGFASELMHLYVATELEPAKEGRLGPDEDERLELRRATLAEALVLVDDGVIADAKSIVGLLWLDRQGRPATLAGTGAMDAAAVLTADHAEAGEPRPIVDLAYQLTMGRYLAATAALGRRSTSGRIVGIAALLGALSAFFVLNQPWYGVFMVVAGLAFLTGTLTLPFSWFAIRRRRDVFETAMRFRADHDGIDMATATGRGRNEWSVFSRIRRSGGFLFLGTGAGPELFVPLDAFDENSIRAFELLALEHGLTLDGRRVDPAGVAR